MDSNSGCIEINGFLNSIYTFTVFAVSCLFLTCLGTFYLLLNTVRNLWLRYLEKKFPDLEFVKKTTLRTVVDTHRNMGVITLLLTVKGNCDPFMIKKRLTEEILEKRQNDGQYVYKHLRMKLTRRWGWYAWQKAVAFNINNHLIFASPHYRGRPISDANIQECVSETVSKYLVPDLPPWQITVFQLLTGKKYYLLIRFHHMLLTHKGMNLERLLTVEKNTQNEVAKTRIETEKKKCSFSSDVNKKRNHLFQEVLKPPKALPKLFERIHVAFTNNWNEYLNEYDPLQNPSILKRKNFKTMMSVFLIVTITVIKQRIFQPSVNNGKKISNEFAQRGMNLSLIITSILNAFNPFSIVVNFIEIFFNVTIKFPLCLLFQFYSLCAGQIEVSRGRSFVKTAISTWIVFRDSIKEALYYWRLFYNGPRLILDEFMSADNYARHQAQFMSASGRKVVSWSSPVSLDKLRQIEVVTGATASEISIAGVSASLREFLKQYNVEIPDTVLTMARYFSQEQLIQCRKEIADPCGSGILCLPLPIRNPLGLDYEDPVAELRAVQHVVSEARLKQPALYLASLSQLQYGILTRVLPSPILRLILNLVSRRFPVILNEIAPTETGEFKKHYLWDHEIEDLMYWKPPQANIYMSLTLMTFGNSTRLGVVADALLSPDHTIITSAFAQRIRDLAAVAGVTSTIRNYSLLSDESDTSDTSRSSSDSTLTSSPNSELDSSKKINRVEENDLNRCDTSRKRLVKKKLQFNIPRQK